MPTGFQLFSNDFREQLQETLEATLEPGDVLDPSLVSNALTEMWNKIEQEERTSYDDEASKFRRRK